MSGGHDATKHISLAGLGVVSELARDGDIELRQVEDDGEHVEVDWKKRYLWATPAARSVERVHVEKVSENAMRRACV